MGASSSRAREDTPSSRSAATGADADADANPPPPVRGVLRAEARGPSASNPRGELGRARPPPAPPRTLPLSLPAPMPTHDAPARWPAPLIIPPAIAADANAPDALVCPITQCLMTEPALVTSSGRTYDRGAISRWIAEHGTDPLDRAHRLTLAQLAPNLAVRAFVEDFVRSKNGGVPVETAPVEASPQAPAPAPAPAPEASPPAPAPPPWNDGIANLNLNMNDDDDDDDDVLGGTLVVRALYAEPGTTPEGKYFAFSTSRVERLVNACRGPDDACGWALSSRTTGDNDDDDATTAPATAPPLPWTVKDGRGAVARVRRVSSSRRFPYDPVRAARAIP